MLDAGSGDVMNEEAWQLMLSSISSVSQTFFLGTHFFFKLQTMATQFTKGPIYKNEIRTNLYNIPERFYCQFGIPLYMNFNQPFLRDKSRMFYALVIENIMRILNTL